MSTTTRITTGIFFLVLKVIGNSKCLNGLFTGWSL